MANYVDMCNYLILRSLNWYSLLTNVNVNIIMISINLDVHFPYTNARKAFLKYPNELGV